jgi:hypothetical protein
MRLRAAVLILGAFAAFTVQASPPRSLSAAVRDWRPKLPPQSFKYALVDLNDDGVRDAVVLVDDRRYCGSGGCTLLVFRGNRHGSFRRLSMSTITREPIAVLGDTRHGWHTLTVTVAGGEITPCAAIMRFNGQTYPTNPSMQPCAAARDLQSSTALTFSRWRQNAVKPIKE